MQYEIRAMSLGEVVDTSFRILRDHFAPLVGMSAAIYLPFTLAMSAWQQHVQRAAASGAGMSLGVMIGPAAAIILTFAIVAPIVTAAISHAVGEAYLGRTIDVGRSLREAVGIVLPLVGTGLLSGLIMIAATLALIVPGIWFALGIIILYPINVMERLFGMTSIRRSLELMKGQRGRGFLLALLMMVVSMVVGYATSFLGFASPWVGALANGIGSSVTGAFTGAAAIVFYFDIRCRKEAFDVTHLAQLVESGAAARA